MKLCPINGCRLDYEQNGKQYSHGIGVVIRGVYDGTLFWECPFCGGRWHRFGEGDPLRARAEMFVSRA